MWSLRVVMTWLWLAGAVATIEWLAVPSWASGASEPGAPVDVVVTIPVLRDLVERVGGEHVRVVSLLSGLESEHTYSPRPSDLVAVRKARVLFEIGVGLEVWASSLVKAAGNAQLKVVTTSRGIALIREPAGAAPATPIGLEEHSGGNPHVWLDPANAKVMLRHITDTLIDVDPAHASDYRANQASYLRELDVVQSDLVQRVKTLKDRRVIVHHPAWPYFARRFGFIVAGEIVSQPGAEPSAQRLQSLVARMRRDKIRVIVSEPQLNQKLPEMLARETGARVVVLTPLPGGLPGTETYLDMLRFNVHQLARALE